MTDKAIEKPIEKTSAVKVHNRVLGEIIETAVHEIDGISLISKSKLNRLIEPLLGRSTPGVKIRVNAKGETDVEIKVLVRYGIHIPEVAGKVQECARLALNQAVDIKLKNIHVNVQGIERGTQ